MQVNVDTGGVDSEANVTEIHEGLHLDEMEGEGGEDSQGHFGIFSICWANNGQEIAAGTGTHSVLVYNLERAKVRPLPRNSRAGMLHTSVGERAHWCIFTAAYRVSSQPLEPKSPPCDLICILMSMSVIVILDLIGMG